MHNYAGGLGGRHLFPRFKKHLEENVGREAMARLDSQYVDH